MILSLFHALAIRIIPLLLETVSTNPGVTVGVEGGGGVFLTGTTMVDVREGRAIREEHDLGRRNSRSALWIPHNTSCERLACYADVILLRLVTSSKLRRYPCSQPDLDSANYRKCVSNFPST